MQTELEELAHQLIASNAPVFQHRNKTHVTPTPAKQLKEFKRQFQGHIANIKLRNEWMEATNLRIMSMNMIDYTGHCVLL